MNAPSLAVAACACSAAASLAACAPAYKPVNRSVYRTEVADADRSRLTSRFVWDDGDPEYPPPGATAEHVTDTAFLGEHNGRLCVMLQLRTGAKHDAPFGEWHPKINGEPVFPEAEQVSQFTVTAEGERTVVDASFLSNTAIGGLTITQPTTDEYAIIERQAWFCPMADVGARLELRLDREYASLKATQGFIWDLF